MFMSISLSPKGITFAGHVAVTELVQYTPDESLANCLHFESEKCS